jgi:hypothetical protein
VVVVVVGSPAIDKEDNHYIVCFEVAKPGIPEHLVSAQQNEVLRKDTIMGKSNLSRSGNHEFMCQCG